MPEYGPVEPLADPDADAALRELLKKGGLVPLEVEHATFGPEVAIEIDPPAGVGFFAIAGLTSKNTRDDRLLIDLILQDRFVLRRANPASFNLGHLVPMDLGVFGRLHPLELRCSVDEVPTGYPTLHLTLWGVTLAGDPPSIEAARDTCVGHPYRGVANSLLLRALRELRASGVEIQDAELRSAMDRYAKYL